MSNFSGMPTDKKAGTRRLVIDRLLSSKYKKYPSKEEMRQECEEVIYGTREGKNVSTSIIEKDMKFMKDNFEAPIKYDALSKGYYYDDPGFSIGLTENEYESLLMASRILDQLKDTEIFEDYDTAIQKVVERLELFHSAPRDKRDIIQLETVPFIGGSEYLEPLISAIKDKKRIKFLYRKFQTNKLKEYEFEPYLLREYRNRWYLIGLCPGENKIKTYALDRIEDLYLQLETFEPRRDFNIYKLFKDSVGITINDSEPEKVIIEVTELQAEYLNSQPWHISQKEISRDNGKVRFELEVILSFELEQLILGLGDEVEVIAPDSFRSSIKQRIRRQLDKYME